MKKKPKQYNKNKQNEPRYVIMNRDINKCAKCGVGITRETRKPIGNNFNNGIELFCQKCYVLKVNKLRGAIYDNMEQCSKCGKMVKMVWNSNIKKYVESPHDCSSTEVYMPIAWHGTFR